MNQSGDAYGQPGESVDSLSDIAANMGDDTPENEETLETEGEDEAPEEPEEAEVDAESDEETDDSEDEEPAFTIKHDGKEVTLKKSELVELAQKGFDYSVKTMQVAEERKAAEAERAAVAQTRQHHERITQDAASKLDALVEFMGSQLGDPPPIEWASQDANYYLVQKEQYEARKGQLQDAIAARNAVSDQQARQRHAWLAEQANATEKALRDTLPGWKDDTLPKLAGYMGQHGLTPETLDGALVQKGLWELAHKAQQYDELQARKAQLKPKAELPKVTPPKASNQSPRGIVARQSAEKAYRAKPSIDTLANLLD